MSVKTFFRDFGRTVGILLIASLIAYYAKTIGDAMDPIVVIYIFAVMLISRFTDGYFWGIVGSAAGVILTNYIFTFPYLAINFSIEGYPITFLIMLATAMLTGAMTSAYKQKQEEAEDFARRLEESYEERLAFEKAAEQEKMRNNLLRAISHDLRTPLTGIKGAATIMLENSNTMSAEERDRTLNDMVAESDWLIRMVENLLTVTHISSETMKVEKNEEIAEEVVASAVSHFNSIVPGGIEVRVPEELILVPMDPTLIEQVLINLLDNAIKHSGVDPRISVELKAEDGNAVFTVSDNGVGITESEISYIFEYGKAREESYRTDSTRGFGIGLPTCKTLVEAHGGKIRAYNNPSGGSSFSFYLPLTETGEKNEQQQGKNTDS